MSGWLVFRMWTFWAILFGPVPPFGSVLIPIFLPAVGSTALGSCHFQSFWQSPLRVICSSPHLEFLSFLIVISEQCGGATPPLQVYQPWPSHFIVRAVHFRPFSCCPWVHSQSASVCSVRPAGCFTAHSCWHAQFPFRAGSWLVYAIMHPLQD